MKKTALLCGLLCLATYASEMTTKEVAPPPLLVAPTEKTVPPRAQPRQTITALPSSSEPAPTLAARVPAKRARTWMMSFGPGLAFYNGPDAKETKSGMVGFASHFGGVTQLTSDSPVFLGVDIGLQFWSFDSKTADRNATGVQILPTGYYNFDWSLESSFQPYLGLAMGPHIYFSRTAGQATETSVNLQVMFRPGVTFLMAPGLSMNFEPKIGFIGTDVVFFPVLAANLFL